jgi:hypothetical protein
MEDDVVTLRVFMTHIEADLARSALEAAGIESVIVADDAGGLRPHFDMTRGVALQVYATDVDQALAVLDTPARPV